MGWWDWRLHIRPAVACHDAAVLCCLHISRRTRIALYIASEFFGRLLECCICPCIPGISCEALDFEAGALPLSSWLASSIEGAKARVDGALVGFRAELGCCWDDAAGEDFAVLSSVMYVSNL